MFFLSLIQSLCWTKILPKTDKRRTTIIWVSNSFWFSFANLTICNIDGDHNLVVPWLTVVLVFSLPLCFNVGWFRKEKLYSGHSCKLKGRVVHSLTYMYHFSIAVERRRRFNINDRIKELGTLLPKQDS